MTGRGPVPRRLGLAEAAEMLGVHYMTAYRYVRLGRLAAQQEQGRWTVALADVERMLGTPRSPAGRRRTDWARRCQQLKDRMKVGDLAGSWDLVEQALARGASGVDVHLKLIAPVMREVGDEWQCGRISVEDEHRATAVAVRVVGHLSSQFAVRGRTLGGTVVVGAAPGDHHSLPVMIVADVLRGAGLRVVDLGADVPVQSFLQAAGAQPGVLTFSVTASTDAAVGALPGVLDALRLAHPGALLLAGGPALTSRAAALAVGVDDWYPDAATLAAGLRARHGA